jgi:hypothetical protein
VVPGKRIALFAGGGVAGLLALLWLIFLAPPPFGPGAALLWAGSESARESLLARVEVKPGNVSIRKGSDQWITATVRGFNASRVMLFVRAQEGGDWETIPMSQQANLATYEFLLASVSKPMEYYVEADGARSLVYVMKTIALPEIQSLAVEYEYPSGWPSRLRCRMIPGTLKASAAQKRR